MQVRRVLRRLRPFVLAGTVTGTVIVVRRARFRRSVRPQQLEPPGVASAAEEVAPEPPQPLPPWIESVNGVCPPTHPVKVKTTSGIYHLPGGQFYERTRPERCYVDAAAAEADGYRAAKAAKGTRSPA